MKMNQNGKIEATAASEAASAPVTERISVLLDGEMDRAEAESAITSVCGDSALLRQWRDLHLVGDALRSNEVAACDAQGFCARVSAAIAAEPTILAPRSAHPVGSRRYWAPGLAIAASVAAIAFIAVPLLRAPEAVSIAKAVAPALEASPLDLVSQKPVPTIANARGLSPSFNPYLAAHRELIGSSVVPRAAPYLRSNEER